MPLEPQCLWNNKLKHFPLTAFQPQSCPWLLLPLFWLHQDPGLRSLFFGPLLDFAPVPAAVFTPSGSLPQPVPSCTILPSPLRQFCSLISPWPQMGCWVLQTDNRVVLKTACVDSWFQPHLGSHGLLANPQFPGWLPIWLLLRSFVLNLLNPPETVCCPPP